MAGRRSPKVCATPSARATKDTERVGHLLLKTRWCKFFFEGKCQRGRSCTFAHSASELHAQPDLYRSQLCVEFGETGKCRYGAACRFAHGEAQLRDVTGAVSSDAGIPASGEDLKKQLEEMRQRTRALEAQLEAIEGAPAPMEAWRYDGAWMSQGCWPRQTSLASTEAEYMEDGCQAWDEAAWAAYMGGCPTMACCEMFIPASPIQVAVFVPPAPWQPASDCDAASQPSTDCDGCSGSSRHGADSDAEDAGSASAEGPTGPRVVVRNTFIEFEAQTDAPARRRACSVPAAERD